MNLRTIILALVAFGLVDILGMTLGIEVLSSSLLDASNENKIISFAVRFIAMLLFYWFLSQVTKWLFKSNVN
ncbi:hypothetical protein [Pseudoalteromonas piratica]|uniref:Uncharacterized protein n=1 Tax=Pseudoalteromonas piratica TaxID=1348114 RepID=A0A0A7EBJ9_9GAMM|nr:hypothetical protein [Pseudoalteromonas piratica]AIY63944.1 hypothetical protein OM33_01320 [Pseudoalteromonas piratica]